jgi:hypothetical protein
MQRSNDCSVRVWKLAIPEGVVRYIVAQDSTQAVELARFMSRGDPPPVAVPLRDFSNERGRRSIRVSWCRDHLSDDAGHCRNRNQEQCEVFHKDSSIQYAWVN